MADKKQETMASTKVPVEQKGGSRPTGTTSQGLQRSSPSGIGGYRGGYGGGMVTPFGLVRRMMEDMDRIFGGSGLSNLSLVGDYGDDTLRQRGVQAWSPQVEVFERGGNLVVRADLPGLEPKDVHVNVDDGALTIEGERRAEHEEKQEGYYRSERSYGSFQRRIPLPRGADAAGCDAKFENGVLEVTMKLPASTTRSIPIRTGQPEATAKSTEGQPRSSTGQSGGTSQAQAPQRSH
jgi:HSP20 family protein